jgi:L-ascorbate metabolism protein UlaG (beta-lactamase superfamily)
MSLARYAALVLVAAVLAVAGSAGTGERTDAMSDAKTLLAGIHWFGHDSFLIDGERRIVTDPFKLTGGPAADIILITHEHYDHCSPEDVARVQGPGTIILAPADCARKLSGNVKVVRPGDSLTMGGVDIEAVPAYNTNKKFHPKANGWVGYVFTIGGRRIYLAGDTDYIPEMKSIKCDIALLPVSGTYVMTAEEAAQAALDIGPRVAVPMHYGTLSGSAENARRFRDLLAGKIEVVLLEKE